MNLRSPKFGNVFIEDTGAIQLRTVDGEIDLYKSNDWRTIKRFQVAFEALSDSQAEEMRLFYLAAAGQEIEITDHENTTWLGFIVDPEPQISKDGRGCLSSTSFVFEGEII